MQMNFTDLEYRYRRKKTRREILLEEMDHIMPWDEWTEMVKPYYPAGRRGRKPQPIERMLKMYMLKEWFDLSDLETEEAVYDSYSMKHFLEIDFSQNDQVPDSTTLCKFRRLLKDHCFDLMIYTQMKDRLKEYNYQIRNGILIKR